MKASEKARLLRQAVSKDIAARLHHAQIVYGLLIDVDSKGEAEESQIKDINREATNVTLGAIEALAWGLVPEQVESPDVRKNIYTQNLGSIADIAMSMYKYRLKHPGCSIPEFGPFGV